MIFLLKPWDTTQLKISVFSIDQFPLRLHDQDDYSFLNTFVEFSIDTFTTFTQKDIFCKHDYNFWEKPGLYNGERKQK